MFSKLIRWVALPAILIALLTEGVLWALFRAPVEPVWEIGVHNLWEKEEGKDTPPFKNDVMLRVNSKNHTRSSGSAPDGDKSGKPRILCIGSASTFAMLQNSADTWWGQLRSQLDAAGTPVEVVAWGAAGAEFVHTLEAAHWFRNAAESLKPDVVIVNLGLDDIIGYGPQYKYDKNKAATLPPPPVPGGFRRLALSVSQVARHVAGMRQAKQAAQLSEQIGRQDVQKERIAQMKKEVGSRPPMDSPVRLADADPLAEYLDGLRTIAETCKARGIKLILSSEPTLFDDNMTLTHGANCTRTMEVEIDGEKHRGRPDPVWVAQEMKRYAAAAEKLAAEQGATWQPVDGTLPRDMDHFFTEQLLTDTGAKQMGALFAPVVKKALSGK